MWCYFIQEAHITGKTADIWKYQWPGSFFSVPLEVLMGNEYLPYVIQNIEIVTVLICNYRQLGIKMKLEGNIDIYNVYGPSVENERYPFLETLVENYDKSNYPNEYKVIAGDFNVVANNELNITSGNNHSTKSVNELTRQYTPWMCLVFGVYSMQVIKCILGVDKARL